MTIEISQNVLINLARKRESRALSTSHAASQVIVESEKVLSDVRLEDAPQKVFLELHRLDEANHNYLLLVPR